MSFRLRARRPDCEQTSRKREHQRAAIVRQREPKPASIASTAADECKRLQLRSALGQLLNEFDVQFRQVPTSHGQRWHNRPPERLPDEILVLAPEEQDCVLRATADMRLALASRDYSRAGALWDAVSPILGKVGTYVLKQADTFVGTVNKTVAAGVGLAVLAGLAMAVGLLDRAAAINAILKALHLS